MGLGFLRNVPPLDALIERLEQAEGLDDLQLLIEEIRDEYGVDHIVYHWVNSAGEQYGCGTYDLEWVNRYIEKGYLRIDPVVQGCYQRFHPVNWKRLDWSSKAARALLTDAIAHGVGNQGYSIPLRGPNGQFAMFSLSHDCSDAEWEDFTITNRRDLILLAHYFNSKALEFEPGRTPEPAQPLSPREIEAMTLLAIGYSRAQAADTLSISEHTLRVYVESARHKLGAMNTTHAVARALSRGVIVV
jgi:DNA-binding CsgD family transcriptional regulator